MFLNDFYIISEMFREMTPHTVPRSSRDGRTIGSPHREVSLALPRRIASMLWLTNFSAIDPPSVVAPIRLATCWFRVVAPA